VGSFSHNLTAEELTLYFMEILERLKFGTTHSLPFSLRHVAERLSPYGSVTWYIRFIPYTWYTAVKHTKLLPPQVDGSRRFGVMSVPTLRPLQKISETINISNDKILFFTRAKYVFATAALFKCNVRTQICTGRITHNLYSVLSIMRARS
jgi:hypothetical protein